MQPGNEYIEDEYERRKNEEASLVLIYNMIQLTARPQIGTKAYAIR